MADYCETRRPAHWWQIAITHCFLTGLSWMLYLALIRPAQHGRHNVLVILVCLGFTYRFIGSLVNKQKVNIDGDGVCVTEGPLPFGDSDQMPRDEVASCFYGRVLPASAASPAKSQPLRFVVGVQNIEGTKIFLPNCVTSLDAALLFAERTADALNASVGFPVPVQLLGDIYVRRLNSHLQWFAYSLIETCVVCVGFTLLAYQATH